jgi:chromosome segregation protein
VSGAGGEPAAAEGTAPPEAGRPEPAVPEAVVAMSQAAGAAALVAEGPGDGAGPEFARAVPAVRAVLARLRIQGFKSFADPTTVEVLPGLTGIVGPNGCGKSNVVEALRWAMGETSAKSMRGGEMEDVIFAGTSTRPGRNLAEVALLLEDAQGLAPPPHADSPELEISRRIARGEGSAFRVNGRETRARDVQTLFMDMGSGARASGMVSQGRVAALIGAKPEERRAVLEEAAGIAGLRARRHEAEIKLRQAEANLLRAEDLLGGLDAQRQGLQRQARQANRYRNLSGLVRGAEAEWLSLLRARAGAALATARSGFDQAAAAVREAEAVAEDAARRAFAADRALHDGPDGPRAAEAAARTALERRRVETEGLQAEEARARAALAAAEERLAQLSRDHDHAARAEADAAEAADRLAAEDAALVEAAALLPARTAAAEAALAEAAEAAREAERAAEAATEAAAEAAARAGRVGAELAAAEARARRLAGQRDALAAEHEAALAARVAPEAVQAAGVEAGAAEAALAARR